MGGKRIALLARTEPCVLGKHVPSIVSEVQAHSHFKTRFEVKIRLSDMSSFCTRPNFDETSRIDNTARRIFHTADIRLPPNEISRRDESNTIAHPRCDCRGN